MGSQWPRFLDFFYFSIFYLESSDADADVDVDVDADVDAATVAECV
jgi:hypothetical protein